MPVTCATRALKNLKYLQRIAPHLIPRTEPLSGFASIVPLDVLARIHVATESELKGYPELREALKAFPFPAVKANVLGGLFFGTIYVVGITFNIGSGGTIAISPADMAVANQFASLAVLPISAYASQYGSNAVTVSPVILPFTVNIPTNQYNDQMLQTWVNALAAQQNLPAGSCLIMLSPPGVVNTTFGSNTLGYHGHANIPYCSVNVYGQNLTLDDRQQVYALQLSHEIAEMVVDPIGDNPEVCDSCAGNCNNPWLAHFGGAANAYLGTFRTPQNFPYTFFINAIARPNFTAPCPQPNQQTVACVYGPPWAVGRKINNTDATPLSLTACVFQNQLFLFWKSNTGSEIFFTASADGQNWPSGRVINNIDTTPLSLTACVFQNQLFLFWKSNTGSEIFFTASADGQNWPRGRVINNTDATPLSLTACVFQNQLFLFWKSNTGSEIFFTASADGQNWPRGRVINNIDTTPLSLAACVFQNQLFLFWKSSTGSEIFFTASADGQNWPRGRVTNNIDTTPLSLTACVFQNQLFLFWKSSTGSEIFFTASADGQNWPRGRVINNIDTTPQPLAACAFGNLVYAFWKASDPSNSILFSTTPNAS